jgi:hypothetical protein
MLSFKEIILSSKHFIKNENGLRPCENDEEVKFLEIIDLLFEASERGEVKLLLRGTKLKLLSEKLITKLNSNDSLFDGLFLVGEKAKNYLHKDDIIPHPIKAINTKNAEVADFIFDEYSKIKSAKISNGYFGNPSNKQLFISSVKDQTELIDYYLFGLHTWNSDFLVNFVSTTSNIEIAFQYGNDLIIFLWLPNNYVNHTISRATLASIQSTIIEKGLPLLEDSFFKEEQEYSFKGFVLPHFIIGAFKVQENEFVINPSIMNTQGVDWIENGLEVDGDSFLEFIKNTKYQRFLTLYNNNEFIETKLT